MRRYYHNFYVSLDSEFIANYGSVFVLLLLCAYYSYATYGEQHPITSKAGIQLAQRIVTELQQHPSASGSETFSIRTPEVLIVIRDTAGDRRFAEAIAAELQRVAVPVAGTVAGTPAAIRAELVRLGEEHVPLGAIATHQPGSTYGPLRSRNLDSLRENYPSLARVQVFFPQSYYWPSFLTRENLVNVVNQNADIAIIAIGMTLVIIAAGIDLSVGSLLAISAVVTAVGIESWGGAQASTAALIFWSVVGILACTAGGLFNGVMVTFFRVPAFVVTLAMMMIARGIALIVAVRYQAALSGGATEGTPEAVKIHAAAFSWLGNGVTFGIPNPILVMLVLYGLGHYMMTQTAFGRYIYAVGGNPEAARLSGVPVRGVLIAVYAICATMAGIGGVLDASRFEGGRPNAGELYELQVIAAVVVGGTSLAGGQGKVLGTLIGAMIIAVIQNGLNMAGVKSYEQKVVFGGLILVAVVLDQLKRRR